MSIRSNAVRRFKFEQERARIEKPELRLSGRRVEESGGVTLSFAIWVLCGDKWCCRKVKKRLENNSSITCRNWTLEVHIGSSIFGASQDEKLVEVNLERPILRQDKTALYLHVEPLNDGGSACGRLVCSTLKHDGSVAAQRFSRLGGRLDISSDQLLITTAHGMLQLFAISQSFTRASENHSASQDLLDWTDTGSENCTAESSDCDIQTEDGASFRDGMGYKDPHNAPSWIPVGVRGPVKFPGLEFDEKGASGRNPTTSSTPEIPYAELTGSDFALLEIPEMAAAGNSYCDRQNKTWVTRFSQSDDMLPGQVMVLVDDAEPVNGFLLPQSSSISVRGITMETTKVELEAPLGRFPTIFGMHARPKANIYCNQGHLRILGCPRRSSLRHGHCYLRPRAICSAYRNG